MRRIEPAVCAGDVGGGNLGRGRCGEREGTTVTGIHRVLY